MFDLFDKPTIFHHEPGKPPVLDVTTEPPKQLAEPEPQPEPQPEELVHGYETESTKLPAKTDEAPAAWLTWSLIACRLLIGCFCLFSSSLLLRVIAVSEILSAALATMNETRMPGKTDTGWRALLCPLCYVTTIFLQPGSASLPWVEALAIGLMVCEIACLVNLGPAFTAGRSRFVGLVDFGVYRWVRHPLATLHVAMRILIYCANPSDLNAICLVLYFGLTSVIVLAEESFLSESEEWREYARWVPYRFIPGII